MGYLFPPIFPAEMIRPEERDYERIEPSIRGIGDQEGKRGKTHDGSGRRQARRKQAVRQQAQKVIRQQERQVFQFIPISSSSRWKKKDYPLPW